MTREVVGSDAPCSNGGSELTSVPQSRMEETMAGYAFTQSKHAVLFSALHGGTGRS